MFSSYSYHAYSDFFPQQVKLEELGRILGVFSFCFLIEKGYKLFPQIYFCQLVLGTLSSMEKISMQ